MHKFSFCAIIPIKMKISTRGRYALRFMIYLARHSSGSFIALKDVSENEGISIKYLEQITSLLSKFGLLQSVVDRRADTSLAARPKSTRPEKFFALRKAT